MLCLSSKGRYATRVLVFLASGPADQMCTTTEIAASEGLSTGYVQQLMGPLQAAGLVVGYRGKQGGFRLARSAHLITVADALRVVEGEFRLAPCHDGGNCERIGTCAARETWVDAATLLEEFFERTTIAQLVERAERMAADNQHSQPQLEPMLESGTEKAEKGVNACRS
jgi:Rrf2 family protein